jgi:hypothetical protein
MTKQALLEKIESLPPEKRAEVEDFVDFLAARGRETPSRARQEAFPRDLLDKINADREALRREQGLFPDSTEVIRELREHGE